MTIQTIPDPLTPCMGADSPRLQIRHVVEDVKSEALEKFIAELMSELLRQGFSLAEVLNALATWSYGQVSDKAVKLAGGNLPSRRLYVKTLEELSKFVQDSGK